MRTLTKHLTNYAAYHRDKRNLITHFIGIPMIVIAVVILWSRPSFLLLDVLPLSPAILAAIAAAAFYFKLDFRFGVVMALFLALALVIGAWTATLSLGWWLFCGVSLFVIGWIFQFVGHYFEGMKPAFVDDISGLIIGPLFVAAEIAFMLGLRRKLQSDIEAQVGPLRSGPQVKLRAQ
jgi:uncharacterized membrane protein YGL010W